MSSSLWHFHVLECFIACTPDNRGRSLSKEKLQNKFSLVIDFTDNKYCSLPWTLLLNCCNIIYDFFGSFKHSIFSLLPFMELTLPSPALIVAFTMLHVFFFSLLFYDLWIFPSQADYLFFIPQCIPASAELDWERRCHRPTDIDHTPTSFPCTKCKSYASSCVLRVMKEQTFVCHHFRAFLRLQSRNMNENKEF